MRQHLFCYRNRSIWLHWNQYCDDNYAGSITCKCFGYQCNLPRQIRWYSQHSSKWWNYTLHLFLEQRSSCCHHHQFITSILHRDTYRCKCMYSYFQCYHYPAYTYPRQCGHYWHRLSFCKCIHQPNTVRGSSALYLFLEHWRHRSLCNRPCCGFVLGYYS